MTEPSAITTNIKQNEKLAIVGWASSTRDLAPFADPSFDVWGCNEIAMMVGQRFTANFQLHNQAEIRRKSNVQFEQRLQWIQKQPYPTLVGDGLTDVPNTLRFPFEDLMAKYGRFFTSSIAWMFVYAMDLGYKEIHIYGVDMAADDEYAHQRPCLGYWIGRAEGLGVNVYLPPGNTLLIAPYVYAIEEPLDLSAGPLSPDFLNQCMGDAERKRDECAENALRLEGTVSTIKYFQARNADYARQMGIHANPSNNSPVPGAGNAN